MPKVTETILWKLEDERIFRCELIGDNRLLEVTEMCDECFTVNLNKEKAQQLVNELQELVNQMSE